jgi:hypothetical protein
MKRCLEAPATRVAGASGAMICANEAKWTSVLPRSRCAGMKDVNDCSVVSAIEPFSIHYGPLRHYLPHPGVCLTIEPQDKLNGLRSEN